eukprot:401058-Prorocentrum_minimum.AAC.2
MVCFHGKVACSRGRGHYRDYSLNICDQRHFVVGSSVRSFAPQDFKTKSSALFSMRASHERSGEKFDLFRPFPKDRKGRPFQPRYVKTSLWQVCAMKTITSTCFAKRTKPTHTLGRAP